MNNDVRWKQRFQNFEKSYLLLSDDVGRSINSMSDLEKAGIVQHFEILIKLSWKLMKDYLEYGGHIKITGGAKQIMRQAFQDELIVQGEDWMKALEFRNQTSHIYDSEIMEKSLDFIENKFYPIVQRLYFDLKKEL